MLQQFRALPLGQKIYVLCLLLLALAFLPFYALVISRVGYDHQGTLFLPQSSQDSQVYSAKFLGEPSCFTVFPDKSVLFQHGQQTYGPYTARLDGSALPEQHPKSDQLNRHCPVSEGPGDLPGRCGDVSPGRLLSGRARR